MKLFIGRIEYLNAFQGTMNRTSGGGRLRCVPRKPPVRTQPLQNGNTARRQFSIRAEKQALDASRFPIASVASRGTSRRRHLEFLQGQIGLFDQLLLHLLRHR